VKRFSERCSARLFRFVILKRLRPVLPELTALSWANASEDDNCAITIKTISANVNDETAKIELPCCVFITLFYHSKLVEMMN